MINAKMRDYNFFTFGTKNAFGEETLSAFPTGTVRMSIHLTSQTIQDNINYKDCNYIGFTHDTKVDDTYVIEYEGTKLKVLYVNPNGRFRQVYMVKM